MRLDDLDSKLREKVLGAFLDDERQIGDVTYTDEEKAQLKEYYLSLEQTQYWTPEATEIATAYIVSVIKNYTGDWTGKEFWNRIIPQIGWKPDYEVGLPAIGDSLKRYGRPLFVTGTRIHKYVESLFYQAYSPQTSVKSFIKLAWSLYTDESVFNFSYFDMGLGANLCEAIIKSLDNHYKDVDFDSDFIFESSTYSIRAGLRYAFEQDKKGATLILRRILKYIDFIYHQREKVDESKEGYLGHLCNETVIKLIATHLGPSNNYMAKRARETIDDIDKIKATYLFHKGELKLYFPKIRLFRDNQQFEHATITIYLCLDDQRIEIDKKIFECVGEDFRHMLDEVYCPLGKYLDYFGDNFNIAVTLSFDDNEPCYDSKKSLFRHFFVFDDESERKASILAPNAYRIIFPSNFNIGENIHSNSAPIVVDTHTVDISLIDGDRISFNGFYVFFGEKEKGAHFFFDENQTEVIDEIIFKGKSSEAYSVYVNVGNLIIRTDDKIKADCLDVQFYSDDGQLLYRNPLTAFESENDVFSISIESILRNFYENDVFLSVLVVKDQSENKVYFSKYISFLPDISIEYGKSPYVSDGITETVVTFLGKQYTVDNSNFSEVAEFNTSIGIAEIQIPFLCWRINQGEYHWKEIGETLPYLPENFQSNDLLVINSFYKNIRVFCGDNEIEESNKKGQFLLGKYFSSSKGHKSFIDNESLRVEAEFNGDFISFPIFSITDKPYLLDPEPDSFISFENGILRLLLEGNYRGDKQTVFKIVLDGQSTNNYHYETIGNLKDEIIIKNVSSDIYDFSIYYRDPYSNGEYWTQIWSDEVGLGDLNEIRFQEISRININKISRNKIKNLFLTNIRYIGDDGFGLRYSCKIHSPSFKAEYCEFVIDYGVRLNTSNVPIVNLYYKDQNEIKEYSFDTILHSLSKEQIDGKRYCECLSIYAKTE